MVIPILAGIIRSFSGDRIQHSIISLINNIEFLLSIVLAVYLTSVFSNSENTIWASIYQVFVDISNALSGKDVWANLILFVILVILIDGLLHVLTIPVYRFAIIPMSNKMSAKINKMHSFSRRLLGGLWQLPTSLWLALVFSLLINLYTGFYSDSILTEHADRSEPYQYVEENVIQPLLQSSVVKNFQVLFKDSFKDTIDEISEAAKTKLVRYFNGVTLDEAVKSNSKIDAAAKKIVGSETNDKKKANLIYKWVSKNIDYDHNKAKIISQDPSKVSSGAIVAYNTRTGVCFDYACLYVAMCRAVDVKVRFITGLGYSGTAWGDHAWNQVYYAKDDTWINVDTTFGSSGISYFNKSNFGKDHKDGEVQGEW